METVDFFKTSLDFAAASHSAYGEEDFVDDSKRTLQRVAREREEAVKVMKEKFEVPQELDIDGPPAPFGATHVYASQTRASKKQEKSAQQAGTASAASTAATNLQYGGFAGNYSAAAMTTPLQADGTYNENASAFVCPPGVFFPNTVHVVHSWASADSFPRGTQIGPSGTDLIIRIPGGLESVEAPEIPVTKKFSARNRKVAKEWLRVQRIKAAADVYHKNREVQHVKGNPEIACLRWDSEESCRDYFSNVEGSKESSDESDSDECSDSDGNHPKVLPKTVDQSFANILMSWYYSGYYTGRQTAFEEMEE